MDTHKKRWLSTEDLEEEFGFKEATMAKYRMQKKIPFCKIGSKYIRYDRFKIDAWIEEHEVVEL